MRKPAGKVIVHSDQGSQFTSREWQLFLHQHKLEASMSRRGNCHNNAVVESFFQLLKREWVRRRTYTTREAARQDMFEYIEMFYNPKRKHTNTGMLSPVDFEERQLKLKKRVSRKLGTPQTILTRITASLRTLYPYLVGTQPFTQHLQHTNLIADAINAVHADWPDIYDKTAPF